MPQTMVDIHDTRLIREKGLEVLTEELESVGTAYFLRQFSTEKGNWTEDRKNKLAGLSMSDIENDIEKLRSEQTSVFSHRNIVSTR